MKVHFTLILILILILILYFYDLISVFILNNLIIQRGILVPNCFWFNISEKLLSDGSGINLFYNLKKKHGNIPTTYMFGMKTFIITEERHVKFILDNSPNLFGAGLLKRRFFNSFMKDNVGVSNGCPWKHRRKLNEIVLDTDKLHRFANKYNNDIKKSINKYLLNNNHLLKNKIVYNDFINISKEMIGNVIFNTTNINEDVYNIFTEANTVLVFYTKFSLNNKTKNNYINFLKKHINNPNDMSLVKLCVENESSIHEIIHQIPHFIFPIGGLYLTTIPRLLLILSNHKDIFQKVIDEIKSNPTHIYNLTYLRKCILEILRLNNPVVTTFRTLLKDLKLDNYHLKKGEQLLILNNPILRNSDFFKNPNKYIPERWTKETEESYYSISFNQGPQRCPAKELAIFLVQSFMVNFIKITGILKYGQHIFKTKKINTNNIEQMINTCNLEFIFKG
jgi:hypothetical protein